MTSYRSIRIRVILLDRWRNLATYELDTCERTANNTHFICQKCGRLWATMFVVEVPVHQQQPTGVINWTAHLRLCPDHGDGTLIGAPGVLTVPRDADCGALLKRELLLPGLADIHHLEPVKEPTP